MLVFHAACFFTTLCFTEIPIKIALNLKRYSNDTESLAVFTCSVSKPEVEVSWFKDDVEILPSVKYEFTQDGCMHKLTIHQLCVDDYGRYVVVIGRRMATGSEGLQGLLDSDWLLLFVDLAVCQLIGSKALFEYTLNMKLKLLNVTVNLDSFRKVIIK